MDQMEIDNNFMKFKGKTVFITGNKGFKGSWLCLFLLKFGAKIVGYDLPNCKNDKLFKSLCLEDELIQIDGDIRDFQNLFETIEKFQPEIVFHLAAQPIVNESYINPKETFEINVMGSINILESVKRINSIKSVIYVTSDKVYKNREDVCGYSENDELGGRDPYSASKSMSEQAFYSYFNSYYEERIDLGIATVRSGNVIGGGDWSKDRIVPDFIRSIINDSQILIRNPHSIRPWQHVIEVISVYLDLSLKLIEKPKVYSGAWNFGPNSDSVITVNKLCKDLANFFEKEYKTSSGSNKNYYESKLLMLNCDKAKCILNWSPKWNYETTVLATAEWYKKVIKGESSYVLCNEQIDKFLNVKKDNYEYL